MSYYVIRTTGMNNYVFDTQYLFYLVIPLQASIKGGLEEILRFLWQLDREQKYYATYM